MGLSDTVFGATNIRNGLDADKPLNPIAGQIYVATDTNIIYVCYVDGTWKRADPNPNIDKKILYADDTKNIFNDATRATAYTPTYGAGASAVVDWVNWKIPHKITVSPKIRLGYYYYDGNKYQEYHSGYVKIYINGVLVHIEQHTGAGWKYFDLPENVLNAGDIITGTFQAKTTGNFTVSYALYVENLRVMGYIEDNLKINVIV